LRVSDHPPGVVRDKAFEFALSIIALCETLGESGRAVLAGELLRAGTSIGASVEAADGAGCRRDFEAGMAVASKEVRETIYWLRLLSQSGVASEIDFNPYLEKCLELLHLLAAARTNHL
jgi:four helix bundle protein